MADKRAAQEGPAPPAARPPRPSTRPDGPRSAAKYDARRQQVIDVAARVFAEKGYHATSIDDLVAATGLQRGGLYHYMHGKADLLLAIHERFIDPLLATARDIVAAEAPAEETLRRLAHALMQDIANYRDQVTVFLHEWRVLRGTPGWDRVHEARREFEDIVGSVLERGEREGTFAVSELRLTSYAFLGMFNYAYTWFDPDGERSADEIAERFVGIFLDGVAHHRPDS
jgi:TetR/AcrR family transcriptional regulator, cholesterol catabolism regulator